MGKVLLEHLPASSDDLEKVFAKGRTALLRCSITALACDVLERTKCADRVSDAASKELLRCLEDIHCWWPLFTLPAHGAETVCRASRHSSCL